MISSQIIRLGTHAEKEYLLRARSWYSEVLLNANLVEATSSATAVFLDELRRYGRPFTIDPVTYVFSVNPQAISVPNREGGTRLRRTFAALREAYEIPRITSQDILGPEMFDQEAVESFSNAVVSYQISKLSDALAADATFLDLGDAEPTLSPNRILAPYFELSGELNWLEVNIRLLQETTSQRPADAWAVICLDGLLLDDELVVDRIGSDYRSVECNGYMIWLTDFDETLVTTGQIRGFRSLVRRLAGSDADRAVINMYGGFFSTLLHPDGLTGISHGLGYGERRSLIPAVGGGLPPARYYLKPVHHGISMGELGTVAETVSRGQDFLSRVCGCPICRELLRQGTAGLARQFSQTERKPYRNSYRDYPTQEVYRLARYHFLYNRNVEIQDVNSASDVAEMVDQLIDAYADYRSQLYADPRYLTQWQRALS